MSGIKLPDSLVKQATEKAKAIVQQKVGELGKATGIDPAKFADGLDKPLNLSTPEGKSMSKKAVSTLFSTGPKDDLTVVDVYGVASKAIIPSLGGKLNLELATNLMQKLGLPTDPKNSLKQLLSGGSDPKSLLGGLLSGGNPIASALKQVESGWGIDKEGLKDRIVESLGGKNGLINGLSANLQNTLTSTIGLSKSLSSQITTVVNNVTQKLSTGNLTDARDLLALVGEVTGSPELSRFYDDGAETTLMTGLLSEAIQQGMPNAVEALMASARDPEIAKTALKQNIAVSLVSGNLATVGILATQLQAGPILREVPDAPVVLLSSYKMPKGTTQTQLSDQRDQLVATLSTIQPNWGSATRGTETVDDLQVYSQISKDSERVLKLDADKALAIELAKTYPKQSFRSLVSKQYPRAVV